MSESGGDFLFRIYKYFAVWSLQNPHHAAYCHTIAIIFLLGLRFCIQFISNPQFSYKYRYSLNYNRGKTVIRSSWIRSKDRKEDLQRFQAGLCVLSSYPAFAGHGRKLFFWRFMSPCSLSHFFFLTELERIWNDTFFKYFCSLTWSWKEALLKLKLDSVLEQVAGAVKERGKCTNAIW